MANPDFQHKKEYEKYLEKLTVQAIVDLSPLEESWRIERIGSVERMIDLVNSRLTST